MTTSDSFWLQHLCNTFNETFNENFGLLIQNSKVAFQIGGEAI